MNSDRKVIVVTGGATGVGPYIAWDLMEADTSRTVVVVDTDWEKVGATMEVINQLGGCAAGYRTDLCKEWDVRRTINGVIKHFGRIDTLVNSAVISPRSLWDGLHWAHVRHMQKDFWDNVLATNLSATYLFTKSVLPHMEGARSGHIVNVYDPTMHASLGTCVYAVAREGIRVFTRSVAEEIRQFNVCIVAMSLVEETFATEDAPEDIRNSFPGPDIMENRFALAAEADMALSGHLLTLREGRLDIVV